MRYSLLLGAMLLAVNAAAQTPASTMWNDLKAKRDALPGLHQEFDISQTYKLVGSSEGEIEKITLDMSHEKWRLHDVNGGDDQIWVYDGKDELYMDDGGDEFVRVKLNAKDGAPEPRVYNAIEYDWAKGSVKGHESCPLPGPPRDCVVFNVPIKPWIHSDVNLDTIRMDQGVARYSVDVETGMVVSLQTEELIRAPFSNYSLERFYTLKSAGYETAVDASLFKLPVSGLKEVKYLTRWNAPRIKKLLVGKPAPELEVRDIHGNPVSLASYKGKTVLLDFFTTWCPPCQADGPSLEKLYQKYGNKDLMIVAISVSEDRKIVEDYIKKNAHSYPVVLSSENLMPRAYQLDVFPTYIVISPDGTVAAAMEGNQGFADLRGVLKKAAMNPD